MKKILLLLTLLLSFVAGATAQTVLFSEDFEGGSMPTGWTTDGPGSWSVATAVNTSHPSSAGEGSYCAQITHRTTGNATKLITPEIDLSSVTSAELSFMHVQQEWSGDKDELRIYYRTSSTESWVLLEEYTDAVGTWTTENGIVLPSLSSTYQLAFEMVDGYGYGLGIDDVKIIQSSAVPKPTSLTVSYTGGTTAEVSWTSTESSFDIDVNGTVTENVTSPYSMTGLDYATTYNIKVRAKNGSKVSDWTTPVTFNTIISNDMCTITLALTDSYGDGWNGNAIQIVDALSNLVLGTVANTNAAAANEAQNYAIEVPNNRDINFVWVSGSYSKECSFVIYDVYGDVIYEFVRNDIGPSAGVLYTYTVDCGGNWRKPTNLAASSVEARSAELSWTEKSVPPATAWVVGYKTAADVDFTEVNANTNPFTLTGLTPDTEYTVKVRPVTDDSSIKWSAIINFTTPEVVTRPTNLAETNITTNSATLSWEGTYDSSVLQYRPWHPASDDVTATSTMTTYTYDLSAYSGTGSVAIRHYDVTDMFQLIVDNIVVKNAADEVVFSEDFESCSGNMPAAFTNMDLDGDGYEWEIAESTSSNVNGTYGIVSASYVNYVGALTPDNWLILSGIQLGGSISFQARGQDANYPAENFAVYVSTDADFTEVSGITTTSYDATGLTPNTPYAWQVKGISGQDESNFASSFFKTKDDLLVFATDGNWNEISNWKDAEGNPATALPTNDNNVRIDADATISAGVVACAGKTTIDGGSITIMEGGQLKHKAATLRVSMKKNITGYGDGEARYSLIASPFTGITKIGDDGSAWSHIINLDDGDFDLFGFDATEKLEWINYKTGTDQNAFTAGSNHGLRYLDGYLCANKEDKTLEFTGTAPSSYNNTNTVDVTYDDTSTDPFNGWMLVGNPFTCNGSITYSEDATFYKMNATGTGFDVYENTVVLAPGEGAFMQVDASGIITYSSEVVATTSGTSAATLPVLPLPGYVVNQDAAGVIDIALENAGNNATLINNSDKHIANVTLNGRTLYCDGEWNTLCLPFDLDATQLAASPLAGAEIRELSSASISGNTLSINFTVVDEIEAGTPYIIKWAPGTDISNPVFNTVVIDNTSNNFANTDGNVQFKGTYNNIAFTDTDETILFMGEGNTLYWPLNGAYIGACRAYFQLSAGSPAKSFALSFSDDDDPTGLQKFENSEVRDSESWYTLSGVKLNGTPKAKGIYIHNGKKVVIK